MKTQNPSLSKRFSYCILLVLPLLALTLNSCNDKCEVTTEYVYYQPVYTSLADIRHSVEVVEPQQIEVTGKIYFKDGWLFVNEPGNGVHIIDNHNPSAPAITKFIKIPGNYDLAIKGNTLYADSYVDLVALDISDLNNIREVKRLENIFVSYNSLGFYANGGSVVTDWEEVKDVQVYKSECEAQMMAWGGMYYEDGIIALNDNSFSARAAIAPGNGSVSGAGGSMARFTISNNFLYMIDGADVQAINISQENSPEPASKTAISWDLETIFPHGSNLFIGSRSGMHILDISSPATPSLVSTYEHVRVCDPVVVDNDLAFVTLRSGTQCEGFTNQLEVIDIQDLTQPELLEIYPMTNPHGLGIDDNTLFVCDGDDGLKVFDRSDITKIDENLLAHYADINAYDVIPFNNVVMMIGADGIYQ